MIKYLKENLKKQNLIYELNFILQLKIFQQIIIFQKNIKILILSNTVPIYYGYVKY